MKSVTTVGNLVATRDLTNTWVKLILEYFNSVYLGLRRVWGRGEVCTGFWWGNMRERDHWGDPDVDGRIILR